jgi:hypothetical protein
LGISKKTKILKPNGTYQLLVCVDDFNLLGENINTLKKNAEGVLDATKEDGLEQWFPNDVSRGTTRCVAKLKNIYLN